ncbi:retropepsin-like aspartic protease family protein [Stutzerimonas azotifigens]|uniref:retropepsin-like aspartic protease family protein n=1 Tax=Stutzerimonas azotifigens TaxID=291995 RepID=UPI0004828C43
MLRTLSLLCGLACAAVAQAQPTVQVVGLFPNAAVLNVDGQRKLVRVGERGPGGVEVVSVARDGAVLRVDGHERAYPLGREYSGGFAAPVRQQFSVARGAGGHYWVAGSIDGHSTQFLVDTGATSVAMNEGHARRLGIDFRVEGAPLMVSTAGGTAKAWRVKLDSVKVGGLEVLGVEAVVLEGGAPTETLLGMSFLNRISWREEQGMLRLESKY